MRFQDKPCSELLGKSPHGERWNDWHRGSSMAAQRGQIQEIAYGHANGIPWCELLSRPSPLALRQSRCPPLHHCLQNALSCHLYPYHLQTFLESRKHFLGEYWGASFKTDSGQIERCAMLGAVYVGELLLFGLNLEGTPLQRPTYLPALCPLA